ncbi:uncharacterized protein TNCV_1742371 [Trichonephila clavipes]|nr:uncharacterized protein TNCV_1742371 [Trichonephila clavipes]
MSCVCIIVVLTQDIGYVYAGYTRAFGDGPRILNHGQVTWTSPELAPPSPNYHTNGRTFQLDRFNVHRCPTRPVFSGTGLEPMTKQATFRYQYHSATAATPVSWRKVKKNQPISEEPPETRGIFPYVVCVVVYFSFIRRVPEKRRI